MSTFVLLLAVISGCQAPEKTDSGTSPTGTTNTESTPTGDDGGTDSGTAGDSGSGTTTDTSWKGTSGVPYLDVGVGPAACAIRSDNHVVCWDDSGTAVVGTTPNGLFRALGEGIPYCALDMDGYPQCWGIESQLPGYPNIFAGVPDQPFERLVGYYDIVCGLDGTDAVYCWGSVGPLDGSFTDVCVGYRTVCAVGTDGSLTCFDGTTQDAEDEALAAELVDVRGDFTGLACQDHSVCAIDADGYISCWGTEVSDEFPPSDVQVTQITTGIGAYCGLLADQTIACWGNGYLAQGFWDDVDPQTGSFVQLASSPGGVTGCGRRTDGTLACWDLHGDAIESTPE